MEGSFEQFDRLAPRPADPVLGVVCPQRRPCEIRCRRCSAGKLRRLLVCRKRLKELRIGQPTRVAESQQKCEDLAGPVGAFRQAARHLQAALEMAD
jgi:hypothetical protein